MVPGVVASASTRASSSGVLGEKAAAGRVASRPRRVPLNGVCGSAPGDVPAYSNGNDSVFTGIRNFEDGHFTGFQWQCVEFARRWLLKTANLLLPQRNAASQFRGLRSVANVRSAQPVPCSFIPNGRHIPPVPFSLIVYDVSRGSPYGHIGVITEVGDDYVCVADQNRYFHSWGDKTYSARFRLDVVDGRYYIRDPECECSGWLTFPGVLHCT